MTESGIFFVIYLLTRHYMAENLKKGAKNRVFTHFNDILMAANQKFGFKNAVFFVFFPNVFSCTIFFCHLFIIYKLYGGKFEKWGFYAF